jgi:hypothetical protein
MITVNISVKFGGYNVVYMVQLARWSAGPLDAKVIINVSPLTAELRLSLDIEGFKMEFTVLQL